METETLKLTGKHFSKLGLMYFLGTLLIIGLQYGEYYFFCAFFPYVLENQTIYFLIQMLSMYAITMPLMGLLIRTVPAFTGEKKKMSFGKWICAFLIAYAAMYLANIVGNIITAIIGSIKGSAVSNDIISIATSNSTFVNLIIMVILAPIAEELLFRKMLVDRTVKYGEGIAVFTSALFFGLFHGNLNQFAYAFVIGGIFAYVYVKTRNVKYTIFLHMLINFMGSVLSLGVIRLAHLEELLSGTLTTNEEMMAYLMNNLTGLAIFMIYFLLIIALVITGIILFAINARKITFEKTEDTVPKGKRFITYYINIGMLAFIIFWIIRIIFQLFS